MTFGSWSENIHRSEPQKKRMLSAASAALTPIEVEHKTKSATFPGHHVATIEGRTVTMDTYVQENLFSASVNTVSSVSSSAKDAFGCCSRYSACSDARVCLIPHLDYSKTAYIASLWSRGIFSTEKTRIILMLLCINHLLTTITGFRKMPPSCFAVFFTMPLSKRAVLS